MSTPRDAPKATCWTPAVDPLRKALLNRATPRGRTLVVDRRTGWLVFGLWAVPGAVLGLQVSVIGVLLLPVGLVAAILLAKRARVWPEALGVLEGIAGACFLVVALNADYWSCPPSGEVITRTKDSVTVESCGNLNPWPWLIVGLIFAIGGAVAYGVAKRPRGTALDGHVPLVE